MVFVHTALTSLFAIAAMFAITKLIGYRQLTQMSTFDYINGITIGSIAAEMAIAEGEEFWKWVVALVVFGVVTWFLSFLDNHSIHVRRLISGRSTVLLDNGKFYAANFRRANMDMQEFQMECRKSGYFDLSQIQTAILEPNGQISILPRSRYRPATPDDLSIAIPEDGVLGNVILDGKIMEHNLQNLGFNLEWLEKQLKRQHKTDLSKIFVAICSSDGILSVFEKAEKEHRDILE